MSILMDNPFKLLESYTKEDKDIWGGRTTEIDHLYNLSFASNLILIYGMSGVGKTSLIQCGLANRFKRTDWHAIWVLRRGNMDQGLPETLRKEAGISSPEEAPTIPEMIRKIYLKHFKPIFLVFDQLEELFIFGNNDEIQGFIRTIKDILSNDIQCKIILVLREEYHGHLKILQDSGLPVFKASVKIEPMSVPDATESISKLLEKYNIGTPDADYRACAARIANDCSEDGQVDLANLQVYLFWAWEKAAEKAGSGGEIRFTHSILREIGDGRNVLTRYLNAVVERISKGKSGGVWYLLQHFVSRSQTKQPLRLREVQDIDIETARIWLNELNKSKLVKGSRDTEGECYTLMHDSLVPLIIQKKTAASRGRNPHPTVHGNPFKGLPSYEEKDAGIFFGRNMIKRELLAFFEDRKLLVIVGPSGSGKSSIIKAGIIPALRAEGYQVLQGEPGAHPMVFGQEIIKRMKALNGGKFLLYIDQFEELSTQASTHESEEFIAMLNSLVTSSDPALQYVKIVLSVRSDYEYEFERALTSWRESKKTVPDLMESAIREIITEPAYLAGLEYKPAYLVDNIVRDVMQSNGTLPLLSYALEQMYIEYEKSGASDGYLMEDHYNAIGGVVDGLRLRASRLYNSSDADTQRTIKNVMLRMLSLSINEKASKRILADDLVYEDPVENERVQRVLNDLVNSRLIVSGPDENGQIYYEPAHDSLIRSWNLIGDWIKQYGKDLLYLQQDLSEAVKQYKNNPGRLWHEDDRLNTLQNIMKSQENWLNLQETNFIRKSLLRRNELESRKRRRIEDELSRQADIAKKEKELLQEKLSKQVAITKLNNEKEAALVEKLNAAKAKNRLQKQRTWLVAFVLLIPLGAAAYIYGQWNELRGKVQLIGNLKDSADQLNMRLGRVNDSLKVTAVLAGKKAEEATVARQKADSAARKEKAARRLVEQQKKILQQQKTSLQQSQKEIQGYVASLTENAASLKQFSDSLERQLIIIKNKNREVETAKLTASFLTRSRSLMRSDPALAYQLALESLKYDSTNRRIQNYIHDTLDNRYGFYESFIVENVSTAFFSDNGKAVLAVLNVRAENKILLLDLEGHKEVLLNLPEKILSAQFNPIDNNILIATSNRIYRYNANGVPRASTEKLDRVLKAVYTARGRIIIVTANEIQLRKTVDGPATISIPSRNNTDDTEVSSNDTLLYVRRNDVIEAYDLSNARSIRAYKGTNSFLDKGGNGFIAVNGNDIMIARSAGNKVITERYPVKLEKGYSQISVVSIADNLRSFLFMAEPTDVQQMQQQQMQQQQQISKNFTRPAMLYPPLLYVFEAPHTIRKIPNDIPFGRRVTLSENGDYIISGEGGSLAVYDMNGKRTEHFGGYTDYNSWAFNPVNTEMILSMNNARLKLWVKGTPNSLSAQNRLRTFSASELEKAVEDIALR